MTIVPVLDILNGIVVQGVAGDRKNYRPISSVLTPSRDPSVILNAVRAHFGLTGFYLADLDAIEFRQLNRCAIAELTRLNVSLMVDAGVRCERDVEELLDLGVDNVVVGLETLGTEAVANKILTTFDTQKLILSLDLKYGKPLTDNAEWQAASAGNLAQYFIELGYENIIVLDLAAVGTASGISTLPLCREIRPRLQSGQLITGGGISGPEDLHEAQIAGVDGVLVASALHNGALQPDDFRRDSPQADLS